MAAGRRLAAALVFCAFTAPFGIAAHLVSELAGLGWHDDADVAFSARHGYLAAIAVAAVALFAFVLRRMPAVARRRRVAEIVAALPYRGQGIRFVALAFGMQFAFFAVTQLGEGCPLCSGDVFTGATAAAATALLGALLVAFGKRRFLEFAAAFVWLAPAGRGREPAVVRRSAERLTAVRSVRRTPFSFRYRPPPLAA